MNFTQIIVKFMVFSFFSDIGYPPPDRTDPAWLRTMIVELKTLQSRVTAEAVRAKRELNAALTNVVLTQAELKEECVKMGLVMTMVTKIVGQDVADAIVRDAENTAKAGGSRGVAGDGLDQSVVTSDPFVAVQSHQSCSNVSLALSISIRPPLAKIRKEHTYLTR